MTYMLREWTEQDFLLDSCLQAVTLKHDGLKVNEYKLYINGASCWFSGWGPPAKAGHTRSIRDLGRLRICPQ